MIAKYINDAQMARAHARLRELAEEDNKMHTAYGRVLPDRRDQMLTQDDMTLAARRQWYAEEEQRLTDEAWRQEALDIHGHSPTTRVKAFVFYLICVAFVIGASELVWYIFR